ncbi:hypothetical protein LSTR_LSTR011439 [Laodelphax striatellus]|uniref:DUF4802 domain-containing protein n=1 Tax=Laodelphax striatellus TaxID=195883 RepID=A0A482WH21_LAOST|nr:hypothetical protein LSTR_LSTR011439 [Laodelphax striatellus]
MTSNRNRAREQCEMNDRDRSLVQQSSSPSPSPPPSYETVLSESGENENDNQEERKVEVESPQQPAPVQILHKSSKELYKAVAAQWGITCKMSDHCRCMDCQSHYLDCEYDRDNEQEKTDGGLAAGTPMYLSEVMQGTACTII